MKLSELVRQLSSAHPDAQVEVGVSKKGEYVLVVTLANSTSYIYLPAYKGVPK